MYKDEEKYSETARIVLWAGVGALLTIFWASIYKLITGE